MQERAARRDLRFEDEVDGTAVPDDVRALLEAEAYSAPAPVEQPVQHAGSGDVSAVRLPSFDTEPVRPEAPQAVAEAEQPEAGTVREGWHWSTTAIRIILVARDRRGDSTKHCSAGTTRRRAERRWFTRPLPPLRSTFRGVARSYSRCPGGPVGKR